MNLFTLVALLCQVNFCNICHVVGGEGFYVKGWERTRGRQKWQKKLEDNFIKNSYTTMSNFYFIYFNFCPPHRAFLRKFLFPSWNKIFGLMDGLSFPFSEFTKIQARRGGSAAPRAWTADALGRHINLWSEIHTQSGPWNASCLRWQQKLRFKRALLFSQLRRLSLFCQGWWQSDEVEILTCRHHRICMTWQNLFSRVELAPSPQCCRRLMMCNHKSRDSSMGPILQVSSAINNEP